MRRLLPIVLFLCACSDGFRPIEAPLLSPSGNQRQGQVEILVKSNHPAIIQDIQNGGGPNLTEAMDTAGVPIGDRPARVLQMQGDIGLYEATPDALVLALTIYGQS